MDKYYTYENLNHRNRDQLNEVPYPMLARLRDLNYQILVKLKLTWAKYRREGEEVRKIRSFEDTFIELGEIPVMVGSNWCTLHRKTQEERIELGECPEDVGGYFIIRGSEKVVVAQERMAYNFVYTFNNKNERIPWISEIRSAPKGVCSAPSLFRIEVKLDKKRPVIRAVIKFITGSIPIAVLLRALGLETDREIVECICYDLESSETHSYS